MSEQWAPKDGDRVRIKTGHRAEGAIGTIRQRFPEADPFPRNQFQVWFDDDDARVLGGEKWLGTYCLVSEMEPV